MMENITAGILGFIFGAFGYYLGDLIGWVVAMCLLTLLITVDFLLEVHRKIK